MKELLYVGEGRLRTVRGATGIDKSRHSYDVRRG